MKTVNYEREEEIGIIELNRPEVLNALNEEMTRDLIAALEVAREDENIKVIVLKGKGRAFCAGADLKEGVKNRSFKEHIKFANFIQSLTRTFYTIDKPIIAAVQGYALAGGCELAMNCDIRIAAEGTKLGFVETKVGATITNAGTFLLPRLVGVGRAKELFFTAEMIDAKEADRIGLVNKVVPLGELDKEVMEMARKIASNFPLSVRLAKTLVDSGLESSLGAMLQAEMHAHCISFASGNREVGMKSARKKK